MKKKLLGIKRKIKNSIMYCEKKAPFVGKFLSAAYGFYICNKLKKMFGDNTKIILMRGATGDIYLQEILMPQIFERQNIISYILTGDGRLDLLRIFDRVRIYPLDLFASESIERAYMLWGAENLDIILAFPWTDVLSQVNRCRVRMTDKFNFMESYWIFAFQMKQGLQYYLPEFQKKDHHFRYLCHKKNIVKGKTVIIAPFAASVTDIFPMFWNAIILELKKRGYIVFINDNKNNCLLAANLFFSYEESVPLLEYAGYFIGLRSGLCDIISSAKCKKIILYPQMPKPLNYSVHRSDIKFSSLKVMGLCEDAIEYETNFSWDIKNKKPYFNNNKEFIIEYHTLIDNILYEFPSC